MNLLVSFTNMLIENNPEIARKKHARPASEHIRVLSKE
jgi:hypothetical protein